jgi:hypothetical protein
MYEFHFARIDANHCAIGPPNTQHARKPAMHTQHNFVAVAPAGKVRHRASNLPECQGIPIALPFRTRARIPNPTIPNQQAAASRPKATLAYCPITSFMVNLPPNATLTRGGRRWDVEFSETISGRRLLQRLDTHHGLGGMCGSSSQGFNEFEGKPPTQAWNLRRRSVRLNHDAGLSPTHPKEIMMRFCSGQHRFYCGIDLHTSTLSLCVVDSAGAIVCEATLPPCCDGLVVGCEWRAEPKRSEAHCAYASLCFGLRYAYVEGPTSARLD